MWMMIITTAKRWLMVITATSSDIFSQDGARKTLYLQIGVCSQEKWKTYNCRDQLYPAWLMVHFFRSGTS
jgi:hypothetical protein